MLHVQPFCGFCPSAQHAQALASVPYDVVSRREAQALVEKNPASFLQVTKPEATLSMTISEHDPKVYAQGKKAWHQLVSEHILVQDTTPCYYVYALRMGTHEQTGIVLQAALTDYAHARIKRHEFTRQEKEDDRVLHMQALGVQSGKVMLVHPDEPALAHVIEMQKQAPADIDFVADDGVQHRLWRVSNVEHKMLVTQIFLAMDKMYIADGHHRAAAAYRVGQKLAHAEGLENLDALDPKSVLPSWACLLAVAFPASHMHIMAYNRVVHDLNGLSHDTFLQAVQTQFGITRGKPDPISPKQFGMFLKDTWYTLHLRPNTPMGQDPVEHLDVSVLQNHLLKPILGIEDPRTSQRIDFVGGIKGDKELEKRVLHDGAAVAFMLHPTDIQDLMRVADADRVMPPKSTWFEPKLRDGLVSSALI